MRLQSLAFCEAKNEPSQWDFECLDLNDVNLIVGMNASGKTRTLNVLHSLAALLAGRRHSSLLSARFIAKFAGPPPSRKPIEYSVVTEPSRVYSERLVIAGKDVLTRSKSGRGSIRAEKLTQKLVRQMIPFKVPVNQVAVFAKRDSLQHPFLEPLYRWGESVLYLRFGTPMGKAQFFAVESSALKKQQSPDVNNPTVTFLSGVNRFGVSKFVRPIIQDMNAVGFPVTDINVKPPTTIRIQSSLGNVVSLSADESDLTCETDQNSMSDGMFRTLAVLVHIQHALLANPNPVILIDDIGEGLDYERSNALIKVTRKKAIAKKIQVVMTTNDRHVMNNVPLQEWHVLERKGQSVTFHNYGNSKAVFDEFMFTGMSNFDFFHSGMFSEARAEN
jgi:energy-coupling factor transporter ATP-binding protein EcfA2